MNASRTCGLPSRKVSNSSGKTSSAADRIPRLARELGLGIRRRRDDAERAVGEVLDLVVVVEDDAPVAVDAEVAPQHVAGEDVGDREVADRVAVLPHHALDLLGRRRVEIEVERGHAPLDVAVPDDHVVAVRLDRRRRQLEELLEQLGREAVARQREVPELERVRHPADAVDLLHHQELPLHRGAVGLLRVPELVLDHLEHVRVRGQVEHVHHQARRAGRLDEGVLRVVQMVEEVAVEQRLALLGEPDRGVELRARLARHQRLQEVDVAGRHVHVDHEVRPREREEDRDALVVEQDRVEDELPVVVVQHGNAECASRHCR